MSNRYTFRGKRLDNGEWAYGGYDTDWGLEPSQRDRHWIKVPYYDPPLIDFETLGQCTGLKDKNGKAIFEGDIIKVDCSRVWNDILLTGAVFVDADFCAKVQYWDDCECELVECSFGKLVGHYHTIYEVLGNIHDNPELMEAKL